MTKLRAGQALAPILQPLVVVRLATLSTGPALITASWSAASAAQDTQAAAQFSALQAIVRAVRNARAEYGVELGRKIAATVLIRGDEALR